MGLLKIQLPLPSFELIAERLWYVVPWPTTFHWHLSSEPGPMGGGGWCDLGQEAGGGQIWDLICPDRTIWEHTTSEKKVQNVPLNVSVKSFTISFLAASFLMNCFMIHDSV